MSRARLVMRSRLPLSDWKYEMILYGLFASASSP